MNNLLFFNNFIVFILIILIFFIFILTFIPRKSLKFLRIYALTCSNIIFILLLILYLIYQNNLGLYQFNDLFKYNINIIFGLDGFSIIFLILSAFLFPICILVSWTSIKYRLKDFYILLFLTEFFLICVFSTLDIFLFYIFFESILIPMFLIIGIWGSRKERISAAYQFFFFTLVGSFFMLIGILFLKSIYGTTDISILLNIDISKPRQIFLWISFFISFAVKVPMVPVHVWLPKAHVEAPTAGSVLLAGILLKLGTYGILRFMLPLFPYATYYFTPLVLTMCVIAIIYSSLTTIRQIDLKKIIAYSSVAHMNYVTLGIFSLNLSGLEGSILLMLSHGIISGAMFICIGLIYDRFGTRIIKYYKGLAQVMPLFAIVFLFLTFSNISFPGTSGFIGEFLIFTGIFKTNYITGILAVFGTILGTVYSIWLYNRIFFGNLLNNYIIKYSDINRREFVIFFIHIFLILLIGIYPYYFLEVLKVTSSVIIYNNFI